MKLNFKFKDIELIEFCVGHSSAAGSDDRESYEFFRVPANAGVQEELVRMAKYTWCQMQNADEDPQQFEPGEKYSGTEYLFIRTDEEMVRELRQLHEALHLKIYSSALDEPDRVVFYCARFVDKNGKRLTAIRRASHFKGVLKKKLIHFVSDMLDIIEDKVFKLDNDFDLIVESEHIHIWRPSAFVALAKLKQKILDAVPENISSIRQQIAFVDFDSIEEYASERIRSASYLASIRTQNLAGVTPNNLRVLCRKTEVQIEYESGTIKVPYKHVMGFLEVLDRRRYEIELVPNSPEPFRAASRSKIKR